jgi:hypothetical protein
VWRCKRAVHPHEEPAEELAAAIDRAYTAPVGAENSGDRDTPAVVVEGSGDVERDLESAVREAEQDLLSTQGKSPAVRLVDLVLFEALLKAASDVHVQPVRNKTLVRYRLDGALHTVRELPGSLAGCVVSRIKVMARLDVAEKRAPQDGRATVTVGMGKESGSQSGRRVDLRISTLPSTYGERVVIRLLDPSKSPHLLRFSALGMPEEVERGYLAQASRTSGIVLSTGPTGSGKTTTLYTTLAWMSATNAGGQARGCELNMMTVEDPVEYDLAGSGFHQPDAGGRQEERHLRHRPAPHPPPGPRRDHGGRGPRRGDRPHRGAGLAHRPPRPLHPAHQRRRQRRGRLLDLGVEPFLVSSSSRRCWRSAWSAASTLPAPARAVTTAWGAGSRAGPASLSSW